MSKTYRSSLLIPRTVFLFVAAISLGACASKPPASNPDALRAYEENNDPLEPWNRAMMQLDQGLDTVFFDPIVTGYKTVVPDPGRRSVSKAIRNFRSPITFANDLLQGEGRRAGTTLRRFLINSTVGFFGFFDVAEEWGLPYHYEDLGQTMAVWGIGEGPYLYVPILGPSGARDLSGYTVDVYTFDPMAWVGYADNPFWWQLAYFGGVAIDLKSINEGALDEFKASSVDYYAALRSAYRQNRAKEIRNGAPAPLPAFEDYDEDGDGDPFSSLQNHAPEQTARSLPKQ